MFSRTLRSGARLVSCVTIVTPARIASRAEAKRTGLPNRRIAPRSQVNCPETMREKVDLPAPFAPTRACTSPAASSKDTPERACVRSKAFQTSRASTTVRPFPSLASIPYPRAAPIALPRFVACDRSPSARERQFLPAAGRKVRQLPELDVDRVPVDRERRFLHRLVEGRMG